MVATKPANAAEEERAASPSSSTPTQTSSALAPNSIADRQAIAAMDEVASCSTSSSTHHYINNSSSSSSSNNNRNGRRGSTLTFAASTKPKRPSSLNAPAFAYSDSNDNEDQDQGYLDPFASDRRPSLPTRTHKRMNRSQHYIPDKIALWPSHWGSEARKTGRQLAGGWGAAAGTRGGVISKADEGFRGNGVLFRPAYRDGKSSSSAYSTSIQPAYGSQQFRDPFFSSSPAASIKVMRRSKWGAGRDAWGKDRANIPQVGGGGFEDDDGVDLSREFRQHARTEAEEMSRSSQDLLRSDTSHDALRPKKRRARWNRFKWALFITNLVLSLYSLAGFIAMLLVWTGMFKEVNILKVVNENEMILSMTAMSLCVLAFLVGWSGILLNNRSFLAVYTVLLWVSFAFTVAPGYMAYKKRTFNLSGKMNQAWSHSLTVDDRRTVQRALGCCGYYSPSIEAAADSLRCYARSTLPGCKGSLVAFERRALKYIYICSFSIAPAHLIAIVTSLLSSDHITYRFGKGITPKEYRVNEIVVDQAIAKQSQLSSLMPSALSHDEGLNQVNQNDSLSTPRPPFWSQQASSSHSSTSGHF